MVDRNDVKNAGIVGLSLAVLASMLLQPNQYCQSREIQAYCYELSSSGYTCYTGPGKTGGKRCSGNWETIKDSLPKNETTTTTTLPGEEQRILIQNKYNKWYVDTVGGVIDLDNSPVWCDEAGSKRGNSIGEVC